MEQTTLGVEPLRSFLKWAGGKTRTAGLLASFAPPDGYGTYLEPFCGSAAVFFAARPTHAILSDDNEDLVVCLQQVAAAPMDVMAQLDQWPNTREFFNEVREWQAGELDVVSRAARVIYLNKTAFRGLWRVNRRGKFNTPYGQYERPYYNRSTLLAAAAALHAADVRHACFREVLPKAQPGDWVYLDPPYVPDREWGDFTRYTAGRFGPTDQADLARILDELNRNGVRWLLTNSNTRLIREMYANYQVRAIVTRRDIALQASERQSVDLVITNYEPALRPGLLQIV